jgi:hypothetical protein
MPGRYRSKLLPALFGLATACSLTLEPREDVVLLVTNGTCEPGPCSSLRILGFPSDQPHTPGGLWSIDLGLLTGPSVCLTLPASREFTITEVPSGRTTIHRWTGAEPLSLGAQPPSEQQFLATPSIDEFVPASRLAWSVTFPGTTDASPSTPCGH